MRAAFATCCRPAAWSRTSCRRRRSSRGSAARPSRCASTSSPGLEPDLVFTPGLFAPRGTPVRCASTCRPAVRLHPRRGHAAGRAEARQGGAARILAAPADQSAPADLLSAPRRHGQRRRLATAPRAAVLPATPQLGRCSRRRGTPRRRPPAPAAPGLHVAAAAATIRHRRLQRRTVPELARFYDIELVVDQARRRPALECQLPAAQLDWFDAHGDDFDRVVYHFGNSGVHRHMFELMRRHPGIVVLHDFFLSGVLDNLERDGYLPHAFLRALYESHGYTGLLDLQRNGRNPSIWKYPAQQGRARPCRRRDRPLRFLAPAGAPLVRRRSAADWRTAAAAARPLRQRRQHAERARRRARRLGLAAGDFLVCSFGMLGRTKLNEELLDAFLASPLGSRSALPAGVRRRKRPGPIRRRPRRARSPPARRQPHRASPASSAPTPMPTTLPPATARSSCARTTRGETSAAVLDCLLLRRADHRQRARLERRTARRRAGQDAGRLQRGRAGRRAGALRGDAALRAPGRSARATTWQRSTRRPPSAQRYPTRSSPLPRSRAAATARCSARWRAWPRLRRPARAGRRGPRDRLQPAAAAPRQLFVDISALVQSDLKTGIQRVVRSILLALIDDPPPGYRIEPVYSNGGNRRYLYARRFTLEHGRRQPSCSWKTRRSNCAPATCSSASTCSPTAPSQNEPSLLAMRERGVAVYFVVYDLLPVLRPDVFPFGTERLFRRLPGHRRRRRRRRGVHFARGGRRTGRLVQQHARARRAPLKLGYFHLGADIDASAPSFGLPPNADEVLAAWRRARAS